MTKHKIAVITGAGSGIGLALTNEFLSRDPNMLVVALCRDSSELGAFNEKFEPRLIIEHVDFNNEAATIEIQETLSQYEQIDYLVHCAGIVTPLKPIQSIGFKEWRTAHRINCDIPFLITQLCLDKFKHSRVLYLTSEQPVSAVKGASAYCVSKTALNMVCSCFRQEVNEDVAVFATAAPGNVDTAMQKNLASAKRCTADVGLFKRLT